MSDCFIPRIFQSGDIDLSNAEIITGAISYERDPHSVNTYSVHYNLSGRYTSFIFYRNHRGYPSKEYIDPLEFDYLHCYHVTDIELRSTVSSAEIETSLGNVIETYRINGGNLELIYQNVVTTKINSIITPISTIYYDPEVMLDPQSSTLKYPGFSFDLNYSNSQFTHVITTATLIKMNK